MIKYTKVFIKESLFKKPSIKIPSKIFKKCTPSESNSNVKIGYVGETADQLIFSSKPVSPVKIDDFTLAFNKSGKKCTYKDSVGFFAFRSDIFYRVKGSAGKSVVNGESFSDFIRKKYPDEFKDYKAAEVSKIMVTPLKAEIKAK